jgi:hypothetical protein
VSSSHTPYTPYFLNAWGIILAWKRSKILPLKPDTVPQAYYPSYLGGRDQEDHSLRPAWVSKVSEITISTNKLGMVAHICHPNNAGDISRRITV